MFSRKLVIKALSAILLVFLSLFVFSGCAAREFLATLGFDTHDYDGEKVINEYMPDSEKAAELSEMVKILTVNSPEIPEFNGTSDAAEKCRDSVLNYMYNANYAKYTGNLTLLSEAAEVYPQMRFSVIIPADDFVNTFYKYFGGKEKVANESGRMFEYLPGVDSYITAAQPQKNCMEVTVVSLEETENTFRLTFESSADGEKEGTYFALIIKRADESCYFKQLKKL